MSDEPDTLKGKIKRVAVTAATIITCPSPPSAGGAAAVIAMPKPKRGDGGAAVEAE